MSMDLCISVFHPRELPEGPLSNRRFTCPLTDGKPYYLLEFPNRSYPGYLTFRMMGGDDCLTLETLSEFNHFMLELKNEIEHDDFVIDEVDAKKMEECMGALMQIKAMAPKWYFGNKIVVVGYC